MTRRRVATIGDRLQVAGRRLRPHRVRQRQPVVVGDVADLQVVAVRRRRVIALERGDVDLVAGRRVDLRAQAALLELRLDAVGVPRLNAERDVIDAEPRSAAAAPELRIERIAAADDDVADLADEALVLAAFVVGLLPAEEVRVERRALLVVGYAEGEVIEPHRLPAGRRERRRLRQLRGRGRRLAALRERAVADLEIEPVRILHVEALEPVRARFGDRRKAARLQLALDSVRVPRLDADAERIDYRVHRTAAAAARAAWLERLGRGLPEDRRRSVVDVEQRLLAI